MKQNQLRQEYETLKTYVFSTSTPEPGKLKRYNNLFKYFYPQYQDQEYRDPTKTQKMSLESNCECLVDSNRGIYIPQYFAENHGHHFENIDQADIKILLLGPICEEYWETWEDVLRAATFTDHFGRNWSLHHDQDLFMVNRQWVNENEEN